MLTSNMNRTYDKLREARERLERCSDTLNYLNQLLSEYIIKEENKHDNYATSKRYIDNQ